MEYLIGDFARIARLGIKTLRYYHEIGLLLPSRTDPINGYRYYDEGCLVRVRAITRLKELDFSLADIQDILANQGEDEQLLDYMQNKLKEVEQKIAAYRQIQQRLAAFIRTEGAVAVYSSEIEIKEVPDLWIASTRYRGRYHQIGEHIDALYLACGSHAAGRPFSLYYDEQGLPEDDADIEVCLPVQQFMEAPGAHCRRLAGGRAVTVFHHGDYTHISSSYRILVDYLNRQSLTPLSPTREIYHKGGGQILHNDPEKYLTEIQFLIP